jgi:hypothetical protein
VVLGDTGIYELPTAEDKENLLITIKSTLQKGDPLPGFIKLQASTFTFSPTAVKEAGNYQLEVTLSDGYARLRRYNFKLAVIDPNKSMKQNLNMNSLGNFTVSKATLKIVSVGRDAKVKLKVMSNERAEDIVRSITNTSFSITVPTKNDEVVRYKIDFRDITSMTVMISL